MSSTPVRPGSRATTAAPRCSDCRSSPSARRRPISAPADAAVLRPASASASTARTTTSPDRSSPNPRSCTNLASVILQMAALGLGDVESFPFVDPPDAHAVRDAVNLLVELGAMQPDRALTPTGRRLARLPIDPRFGRMILEADANGCVREVIVLAAGLSIQDPRERPTGKEAEADEMHARFVDPHSDFVTLLNLWRYLDTEQRARSSNQFRQLCRTEHLNHLRVREWQDVVRQLREATHELGIRRNTQPADDESVHRSLLAGLLSHVGMYDRTNRDHVGARQAHFAVAPGSVLFKRAPRWVMAGELVETNRTWARMVARIEPAWIEPLARHLVRRSHGEPRWDAARGSAMTPSG